MLGLGLVVKETLPSQLCNFRDTPSPSTLSPCLKSFRYLYSFRGPWGKGKKQPPLVSQRSFSHSVSGPLSFPAEASPFQARRPDSDRTVKLLTGVMVITTGRCLAYPSVCAPPYFALLFLCYMNPGPSL